ncbi:MAG: LON peptidase substrate-binding domain-containing protein [Opitutales bacterium]
MIEKIEIPREVPVMTLSGAVLFPKAMMPLHIFETRYRTMLNEALATDRIFVLAALDEASAEETGKETPCPVAGVGIIRACRQNEDGTADLILEGLARVRFDAFVAETPFRRARIQQVLSQPGGPPPDVAEIRSGILGLIRTQQRLGARISDEVFRFLSSINEPECMLDLAIHTLCSSAELQQELLETESILPRYHCFEAFLRSEIEKLKLDRKLRGDLGDGDIGNN